MGNAYLSSSCKHTADRDTDAKPQISAAPAKVTEVRRHFCNSVFLFEIILNGLGESAPKWNEKKNQYALKEQIGQ